MKYFELNDAVLVMALWSGLYLPSVRKVIKRSAVVDLFLVLSILPVISMPIYAGSLLKACLFDDLSVLGRLYSFLSGGITLTILYKLFSFHYNRSNFERLFRMWDSSFRDDLYPELRQELFMKRKKVTDRWITASQSILVFSALLFGIVPYFSTTKKLEHPTGIPYRNQSPDFELLVTLDCVSQIYLCAILNIYNSFILQYVAFEEVQCQYLRKSLAAILGSLNISDAGEVTYEADGFPAGEDSRSVSAGDGAADRGRSLPGESVGFAERANYAEICAEAERKIRIWIRHHQDLIRFHEELRVMYHAPLSVEFGGLAFVIAVVPYMMITNGLTMSQILMSIVYCINTYSIFYVTCVYGDLTQIASESIFRDAFGRNWYCYPRKLRLALLFIILRCGRPMNLFAFKIYTLGSGSFASIFKNSYSFFMFLVQVMNRSKRPLV